MRVHSTLELGEASPPSPSEPGPSSSRRSRLARRVFGAHKADLAAIAGLALAGMAVYGPYALKAGLLSDDWATAEGTAQHGYAGAVNGEFHVLGSKPLLAVLPPVPYAVFGESPEPQVVLAVALAVAASACFYALLRGLQLPRRAAFPIAVLALLFPWSDPTRFWATAGVNNVAICLYMLGALVAIRGLRRPGLSGAAVHAVAATLYAASVLTYEIAGPLAALTGAVYLFYAPARRALPRWGADVAPPSAPRLCIRR